MQIWNWDVTTLDKISCPEIRNITWELSKCMDSTICGTYNQLLKIIKFVIDIKTFYLNVQSKLDKNL
jgi:hypothetical protein